MMIMIFLFKKFIHGMMKKMIRYSWEKYVWGFTLGIGIMLIFDLVESFR